jgi:hypothetical protein
MIPAKKKRTIKESPSAAIVTKKAKVDTIKGHHTSNHDNKNVEDGTFKPMSLTEIRNKISLLNSQVPSVPSGGLDPTNGEAVKSWATQMQTVIEEFNLLLCCISTATYKWGTDRSGAADQNLGLLNSELTNAQDQISSSISQKLTNVLAPVVELVSYKTVVTNNPETGEKTKLNYFKTQDNDPDFMILCNKVLCRNAVMLRMVLMTNFHKVEKCITDYIQATKKDGEHSRGFAY